MLIEFSVANFMSIKERQTISMVASKSTELVDTHTFDAPVSAGGAGVKLLRSAAIYGANAAGKTNLLLAIRNMREIVTKSALEKHRGDPLPTKPFSLDAKMRNAPGEFEIHFIVEGVRYQYGFSATQERVIEEWLIAYPRNRAQRWFDRKWSPKNRTYQWGFSAFLTGEKNIWKKTTRENALFLSTAVQLNSQQLQPLYDWFKGAKFLFDVLDQNLRISISLYDKGKKGKVLDFLKAADLDIDDLRVEEKNFSRNDLPENMPKQMEQAILEEMKGKAIYEIETVHLDTDGKPVVFDLADESSGTMKIFAFAGYWIEALENGGVIFIDELHDHLHFNLIKFLVKWFHSNETNPHNAQLVFTTHETSQLNQEFMRRDQIWFCEKNKNSATVVYPLSDFRPRKGRENLELGYLSGAYGALPYIRET